jgi:hypothetical protein
MVLELTLYIADLLSCVLISIVFLFYFTLLNSTTDTDYCIVGQEGHFPVPAYCIYVYAAWLIIRSVSMHHLSLCPPRLVASKDAETAGALMTFFLGLGLSIGAGFSFLLRLLV